MTSAAARKEALERGLSRYSNGKPCARGHVAERHTTNSTCVVCTGERVRSWRKNNPERHRAAVKRSQERCVERVKAARKKYWADNKEQRSADFKEWYSTNKDRMRDLNRKWCEANRGRRNAQFAEYHAKVRLATPPWLTPQDYVVMEALYIESARLFRETGVKHHVDHIMPLNGSTVSGLHVPKNLRVVPESENVRKRNRVLAEFVAAIEQEGL